MIITLLRKPLEGSVAENTLKHGCGALNRDGTRVGSEVMISSSMGSLGVMHDDGWVSKPIQPVESVGRWPANFIFRGDSPVKELDRQSGKNNGDAHVGEAGVVTPLRRGVLIPRNDIGGASRFFKQFKKDNQ